MKLKLKSARQQIKENEAARDAQFLKGYPYGRYGLHVLPPSHWHPDRTFYTLVWRAVRQPFIRQMRGVRTCISTSADPLVPLVILPELYTPARGYQDRAVLKYFTSLGACLTAARKRGFPEPLIQAFIEELNRKTPPAPLETKQPVQQGEKVTE